MKLSEKLLMVAGWLESDENDLLVNAESDENCLNIVADALVKAANLLKTSAEEIAKTESSGLTEEALDEMAAIAASFDDSDDELLKKQASVLDEILFTLAAPKNAAYERKIAEDDRIEQLKKKYDGTKEKLDELNKISDSVKAIEKSPYYKEYRVMEAPLSTRYCPDHYGFSTIRVGEHQVQCPLDFKIYDYETGYKTLNGNTVPGGDVSEQTKNLNSVGPLVFQTRNDKLGLDR